MTAALSAIPVSYSRRVSFDNLHPDDHDLGEPTDVSRFNSYFPSKDQDNDFARSLGSYTLLPFSNTSRKRLKLPDPPSKLILRNKLSPTQVSFNIEHAIQACDLLTEDINDLIENPPDHVPKLDLAMSTPSAIEEDSDLDSEPQPPPSRRKLYSQMTNEELMALDPQFSMHKTSDLNSFKFDPIPQGVPLRRNSAPAIPGAAGKNKVLYPSLNENNYKSYSLTVKHADFDHEHTVPRTILTVVSGRKHTWNALDWLFLTDPRWQSFPSFLQNGDHLVVAALIPRKYLELERKSHKKPAAIEANIRQLCENLLQYVMLSVRDADLRLKITVELVLDESPAPLPSKRLQTGTKFMLYHLCKQYQPMLVVLGNRSTNLNFRYPIRIRKASVASAPTKPGSLKEPDADEYLVKLSSYMVKKSMAPVILVGNRTIFHRSKQVRQQPRVTFSDSDSAERSQANPSKGKLEVPSKERKDSAASIGSIESYYEPQDNDSESLSSPRLQDLISTNINSDDENRFASILAAISSSSLDDLRLYLSQSKAERLQSNNSVSRVHQIYMSMEGPRGLSFGNQDGATAAYKVKSLISYNEEDERRNEKLISEKKLKKCVSRNSAGSASDKQVKKKKSFFERIGLKKS